MTARLRPVAVVAQLAAGAAGCRTARTPYAAPPPGGAALVEPGDAARLLVQIVAESDPRVSPPWAETAERAADAVAAALAQGGFRTTRGSTWSWNLRVTVSPPLRGADLEVVVEGNRRVLERLEGNGADWGRAELAELGRAVRERLVRSAVVARLAGINAPAAAAPASQEPALVASVAPAAPGRRLAVLEFRGAAPAPVLALLGDQARAAAAEAGRASGAVVLTPEGVRALLRERGRPATACGDAACELEAARAAGVDRVVSGEVTAVGEARVLVLKLVEVASGALVASTHAQGKDDLALVEAAKPATAALFR